MKTKIGKILVGLEEKPFKDFLEILNNGNEKEAIAGTLKLELDDTEFVDILEGVSTQLEMVVEVATKVGEAMYPVKEPLEFVVCPDLCCEGVPTHYGQTNAPYTQKVKVNPNKAIKTVLVDQDGKEV